MTKYLVSFPAAAMDLLDQDMAAVGEAAHGVIREAKAAGVHVLGGGPNEDVAPLMVAADGSTADRTYLQTRAFGGGRAGTPRTPSRHPLSIFGSVKRRKGWRATWALQGRLIN